MPSILMQLGYGDIDILYCDEIKNNKQIEEFVETPMVSLIPSSSSYAESYAFLRDEALYASGDLLELNHSFNPFSEGLIDDLLKKGKSLGNTAMDVIAKILAKIKDMIKNLIRYASGVSKKVDKIKNDIMKATQRVPNSKAMNKNVKYYTSEQFEKEGAGEETIEFLRKVEGSTKDKEPIKIDTVQNAESFLNKAVKGWDKMSDSDFSKAVRERYMFQNETKEKKTKAKVTNGNGDKAVTSIQDSLVETLKICDGIKLVGILDYLNAESRTMDAANKSFERLVNDYSKKQLQNQAKDARSASMSILEMMSLRAEASKLDSLGADNPFGTDGGSDMEKATADAQQDAENKEGNNNSKTLSPQEQKENERRDLVLKYLRSYLSNRSVAIDSNTRYVNRIVQVLETFTKQNLTAYYAITMQRAKIKGDDTK